MSEENNLQPQEEQFETDWSKLSFLTTKEKHVEVKRPFPKYEFAGKIFRISLLSLSLAALLALLIVSIVLGTYSNPSLLYDRGYGVLGFVVYALALLVAGLTFFLSYLYDEKLSLKAKSEEEHERYYFLVRVIRLVSLLPLVASFLLIPLRSACLEIAHCSIWWVVLFLVGAVLLVVLGFLNVKFNRNKKSAKAIESVLLFVIPALVLSFSAILIKPYSLTSIFGIWMLIGSVISFFLSALLFFVEEKHAACHLGGEFFFAVGMLLQLTDLLAYGMIQASPLY